MTFLAFILILASVILHASWHFICKRKNAALAFFILISLGSMVTTLPFTLYSGADFGALPWQFWLFAALGGISGVVCNASLSFAYRQSEVSLAYPLARAFPVIFTAIFTLTYKDPMGVWQYAGMAVVFAGCVIMPLPSFGHFDLKKYGGKALPWIILAALGTTGYTIFDTEGATLMKEYVGCHNKALAACAYHTTREVFLLIAMIAAILCIPHERVNLNKSLFTTWSGLIAGAIAALAYLLVLVAMIDVTNPSFVQAFRQMSLPVGVFMGIMFLKEKITAPKLVGLTLIVGGLVAISLLKG